MGKVYTATYPDGKVQTEKFRQRGEAVSFQIESIKNGAIVTTSYL